MHDTAAFKLVVRREGASKRYDFEAENAKLAGRDLECLCVLVGLTRTSEEIVQTVKTVREHFKNERNSMGRNKNRKSRSATTMS
jgi:hypothetical protein